MRTAQLFFGQNIGGEHGVSEADFRKFVDEELTPRFPSGLTVLEGGGQWKGDENKLIREASKVVVLVLPNGIEANLKLNAARRSRRGTGPRFLRRTGVAPRCGGSFAWA